MTTTIEGYIAGDDLQIEHDVTGVNLTDPVVQMWLTIKTAPTVADPGSLQKIITSINVPGTGQITQDGSDTQGHGTATGVFQVSGAETLSLGTTRRYHYDIQVKTASGKVYTSEVGRAVWRRGVTDSTT